MHAYTRNLMQSLRPGQVTDVVSSFRLPSICPESQREGCLASKRVDCSKCTWIFSLKTLLIELNAGACDGIAEYFAWTPKLLNGTDSGQRSETKKAAPASTEASASGRCETAVALLVEVQRPNRALTYPPPMAEHALSAYSKQETFDEAKIGTLNPVEKYKGETETHVATNRKSL